METSNGVDEQQLGQPNMVPQMETGMPMEPKKPFWKRKSVIISVIILIILIAGGVVAYKVYASPKMVWDRFLKNVSSEKGKISRQIVNISYQDNGKLDQKFLEENAFAGMLERLKLSLKMDAYVNETDRNNPEMDGNITYAFGSGSSSVSAQLQMVLKGKVVYLRIGDIPFLGGAMTEINNGQAVDWIKVDNEKLQEYTKEINPEATVKMPSYDEQLKHYQEIAGKYQDKIIIDNKVLGQEKINGVQAMHFSHNVDKAQLKAFMSEIFEYALSIQPDTTITEKDKTEAKDMVMSFFGGLIDRMEIKALETWVGVFDGQLYKMKFVSTAPSIVGLLSAAGDIEKDETIKGDSKKILQELMDKSIFDGEVNITLDVSDIGKKQEVKEPANAMDLYEKMKEQTKLRKEMMLKTDGPELQKSN